VRPIEFIIICVLVLMYAVSIVPLLIATGVIRFPSVVVLSGLPVLDVFYFFGLELPTHRNAIRTGRVARNLHLCHSKYLFPLLRCRLVVVDLWLQANFFLVAWRNVVFFSILSAGGWVSYVLCMILNTVLGLLELSLKSEAIDRCTVVAKPSPKRDRPQSKKPCRFIHSERAVLSDKNLACCFFDLTRKQRFLENKNATRRTASKWLTLTYGP